MSATSPPVKRRRSNSPSPSPHHSSSKSNDKKISKHKKEKKSSKGDNHNNETHSSSKVNEYIINDEDYFNKSTEFQVWLREDKGIYFNDLSGEEAREKFSKFVKYWNKGKLAGESIPGFLFFCSGLFYFLSHLLTSIEMSRKVRERRHSWYFLFIS